MKLRNNEATQGRATSIVNGIESLVYLITLNKLTELLGLSLLIVLHHRLNFFKNKEVVNFGGETTRMNARKNNMLLYSR